MRRPISAQELRNAHLHPLALADRHLAVVGVRSPRDPHAFFNGLLPEGEARRMIAYDFRVDADDAFALLEAIGRDCAGGLVIAPAGATVLETGTPEPISEAAVAERLSRLRAASLADSAAASERLFRSSLDLRGERM